jgi:O-methyltransferase
VSVRRRMANFLLKGCGLRRLHGTGPLKLVRSGLDEIDLQHLRDSNSCPSFASRMDMHRYLHDEIIKGTAIDYLEFGVYQGESIKYWTSLNKAPQSRFFGFDSFEGLPEDWRDGQPRGHFDTGGSIPIIEDCRVQFVKGWFINSVPPFARDFAARNRLVLHLDADLYGSTMLPLVHFDRLMTSGTLLVFDEFYDREHEYKALMDWRKICGRKFRVVAETDNFGKICAELV